MVQGFQCRISQHQSSNVQTKLQNARRSLSKSSPHTHGEQSRPATRRTLPESNSSSQGSRQPTTSLYLETSTPLLGQRNRKRDQEIQTSDVRVRRQLRMYRKTTERKSGTSSTIGYLRNTHAHPFCTTSTTSMEQPRHDQKQVRR